MPVRNQCITSKGKEAATNKNKLDTRTKHLQPGRCGAYSKQQTSTARQGISKHDKNR
jgi:hypothetical protein